MKGARRTKWGASAPPQVGWAPLLTTLLLYKMGSTANQVGGFSPPAGWLGAPSC